MEYDAVIKYVYFQTGTTVTYQPTTSTIFIYTRYYLSVIQLIPILHTLITLSKLQFINRPIVGYWHNHKIHDIWFLDRIWFQVVCDAEKYRVVEQLPKTIPSYGCFALKQSANVG